MKKISFEDVGAVIATFSAKKGVKGGQVVKVTASGEVGPCGAGEAFCGVALEGRGGFAGVQVSGFAAVKTTGTVNLGWAKLAADGTGGVQAAESGGREYLVAQADSAAGTAVVYL